MSKDHGMKKAQPKHSPQTKGKQRAKSTELTDAELDKVVAGAAGVQMTPQTRTTTSVTLTPGITRKIDPCW